MSVGHGHFRPNHRHPEELEKLLAQGDAPQLMQRWKDFSGDYDMVYLAGYNVAGTVRYIDKDVFDALVAGEIDTGMSLEDTVDCLMQHEGVEKVLLDADNDINSYLAAHELATLAEHEMVRAKGGAPLKYERALKPWIAKCLAKTLTKAPTDLACAPMLDDPDKADRRIIKALVGLGAADAGKTARKAVGYDRSTSSDQCAGCAHWQGSPDTGPELSRCALVDGLVRADRWCKRFEGKDGEAEGDQAAAG